MDKTNRINTIDRELKNQAAMYDFKGGRTITVKLGEKLGKFYTGEYLDCGNIRYVKFMSMISNLSNQDLCNTILKLSNLAKSVFILSPEIFAFSLDGQTLYLGYDFDRSDLDISLYPSFMLKDGILSSYWRKNVSNLTAAIEIMHSKNIFHTALGKDDSYLFRESKIYIIGPRKDGRRENEHEIVRLKKNDLRAFGQFLMRNVRGPSKSIDWQLFLKMIMDKRISNVRCLMNHPVLKDSNERFNYYRAVHDCCWGRKQVVTQEEYDDFWLTSVKPEVQTFLPWLQKLKPKGILDSMYLQRPPGVKYDDSTIIDLLRFIRNVCKHYVKDWHHISILPLPKQEEVERELEETFPGLLSILHNASALEGTDYLRIAFE